MFCRLRVPFRGGGPRSVAGNGGTMAEVMDETLTTKVEIPPNGKRRIEKLADTSIPRKQRRPRRTASQAEEAARTQANSIPDLHADADQHPGNCPAADTGDSEPQLGIDRLIDAIDKSLGEACRVLSQALVEKAKNGSESAMKLLIMLAERKKPKEVPAKKPRGRTLAQRLHSDLLWKEDESREQTAKDGGPGELVGKDG